MIGHVVAQRMRAFVERSASKPSFLVLLGTLAFFSTSSLIPIETLVVLSTLARRQKWLGIGLATATGSALAAVGLYLGFDHFGWAFLAERYPELTQSKAWADATGWLSRYGIYALFVLMAIPLPIPKTPAIAFAGLYRMPVLEVLLAIWLGKTLKYCAYGFVVSRVSRHADRISIRQTLTSIWAFRREGHLLHRQQAGREM